MNISETIRRLQAIADDRLVNLQDSLLVRTKDGLVLKVSGIEVIDRDVSASRFDGTVNICFGEVLR